jgi:ribosomal peptide maturation radical SAM protein 1
MPVDFLRGFLPSLVEQQRNYDLFFEIKSNLSRDDIRLMREAGVRRVQPGVESLSSDVLRLMRKGVTGAQNVNLLRWARYYDIEVEWNLLIGFPNEQPTSYSEQARLMRAIPHLEPPAGVSRVELQRFSPFHFDREAFPVTHLKPAGGLAYVYPPAFDRERMAFAFEHNFEGELPPETFGETREIVTDWRASWSGEVRPSLTFRWSPGRLHIDDARKPSAPLLYIFEDAVAEIYRAISDRPASPSMVARTLAKTVAVEEIGEVLDLFVGQGLALHDEGRYLALAIPDRS